MGLQRVGHDYATNFHFHPNTKGKICSLYYSVLLRILYFSYSFDFCFSGLVLETGTFLASFSYSVFLELSNLGVMHYMVVNVIFNLL